MNEVNSNYFSDRSLSNEEVEDQMIQLLTKLHPDAPSVSLNPGEVLFGENDELNHVYIRLSGVVKLTRTVAGKEIIFHAGTAGRVIGLFALVTSHAKTFYSCVAKTGCTLLKFTQEEMESALASDQKLAGLFYSTMIYSLVTRNRRAVELQLDIHRLNTMLAEERDQLAETLRQLEQAQMRLVQSEKMATLGQLVAGIAHELNNPIAAISRAADFVHQDMNRLATSHPDGETMLYFMDRFDNQRPPSSREQRASRKNLEQQGLHALLAKRLVGMGITDQNEYQKHFNGLGDKEHDRRLEDLETYYELCTFLKNIRAGSERIAKLVSSLRSYAKADSDITSDVNIYTGLEETLSLLGHKLREVELIREYADLPGIECSPGPINQVWTNLINNAVQALQGKGTITIKTQALKDRVVVTISDDGPGIPTAHRDRIFGINFTTKQGKSDFGVGLGLPICKQIIDQHGGTIAVASLPGTTTFTVQLPLQQSTSLIDSGIADAENTTENNP